ncbi:MAG: MOSC domain-containing protein [Thermoanaerobaculia bacterium]
MHVAEIWRYPIKSMAGERLECAEIRAGGIAGDRVALVRRGERIITSRTHSRLLAHHATIGNGGEPFVDGQPWSSPLVAQWVLEAAGQGARIVRHDGPGRFDVLPLLVATDGAIDALGEDGRRLRPNIVIGGVEGLAERSWEGKSLRIGDVTIAIRDLRQRCVMTTFHPDTLVQDVKVLRRIVHEFDGSMALNCSVITPGVIQLGDPVDIFER